MTIERAQEQLFAPGTSSRAKYAALVSSASEGAITQPGKVRTPIQT